MRKGFDVKLKNGEETDLKMYSLEINFMINWIKPCFQSFSYFSLGLIIVDSATFYKNQFAYLMK